MWYMASIIWLIWPLRKAWGEKRAEDFAFAFAITEFPPPSMSIVVKASGSLVGNRTASCLVGATSKDLVILSPKGPLIVVVHMMCSNATMFQVSTTRALRVKWAS